MLISKEVLKLSFTGCKSILEDLNHVSMNSFNCCDTKQERLQLMKQVIQININEGLLDEIEVLIVLSGE